MCVSRKDTNCYLFLRVSIPSKGHLLFLSLYPFAKCKYPLHFLSLIFSVVGRKKGYLYRKKTYPEKKRIPKRYVSRKDTYPFLERKQVSFYLFLRVSLYPFAKCRYFLHFVSLIFSGVGRKKRYVSRKNTYPEKIRIPKRYVSRKDTYPFVGIFLSFLARIPLSLRKMQVCLALCIPYLFSCWNKEGICIPKRYVFLRRYLFLRVKEGTLSIPSCAKHSQKRYGCWYKASKLALFQQQKGYGQILSPVQGKGHNLHFAKDAQTATREKYVFFSTKMQSTKYIPFALF